MKRSRKAGKIENNRAKVDRVRKPLTRKERRRQERSARKKRAAIFHSKRSRVDLSTSNNGADKDASVVFKRGRKRPETHSGFGEREKGGSKPGQCAAVAREDKEIARLEKLLKMRKRKKRPTSFKEEGLDYLLDLTDKNSSEWNLSSEESDIEEVVDLQQESDSEPEETSVRVSRSARQEGRRKDSTLSSTSSLPTKPSTTPQKGILKSQKASSTSLKKATTHARINGKRVRFSLEGRSLQDVDFENDSETSEEIGGEEREEAGMEVDGDKCDDRERKDYSLATSDGFEEMEDFESDDGYIDSDGSSNEEEGDEERLGEGKGSMAAAGSPNDGSRGHTTYVPPHLRVGDSKTRERLRKSVQGLINRLSESNMQSISSQLEQLYRENSRNDMNSTLSEVLLKSCVSPSLLSDRLALEHMMLVAILHHKVGQEVGAHVVQSLAQKLGALLGDQPNYGRGKECDSVVLLLAHLYNYRVIHCLLIYDIIRKLVETFSERDVELLLLLLKNTGMEIRKDDAASLKEIILQIQSKAVSSNVTNSTRTRFMLDTITALRTNNARKIPSYDPSLLEHMKKLLRGLVHSSGSLDEAQLKISLQDLLNADTHGRWWIVGSAWSGRETNSASSETAGGVADGALSEAWVLELARRQRMNTDVRKNIFCVIMTSEDYVDSFEKLVRLGLREAQEREIIHVLLDCCLQEKNFNPYYAHLGQKLCEFKRSHQVTFQYALWDRFKTLASLTASNRINLRKLVCHLVSTKALSLSVLKVVEFGELEETGVKFYKSLFRSVLLDNSEEAVTAIFSRIAPLPKLKTFRTELILFVKHFLTPPTATPPSTSQDRGNIAARIKLAEQTMKAYGHVF